VGLVLVNGTGALCGKVWETLSTKYPQEKIFSLLFHILEIPKSTPQIWGYGFGAIASL